MAYCGAECVIKRYAAMQPYVGPAFIWTPCIISLLTPVNVEWLIKTSRSKPFKY
jgi:hypothetical protein